MKVKMTVRKRTKVDGLPGIKTSVSCLVDIRIGSVDTSVTIEVPESQYEEFAPGTIWESELGRIPD